MFEKTFLPHQLLHLLAQMRWLKVIHKDDEGAIIELYGQQIKLLGGFFIMLATEWKIWERYYLPNFSLDGKTVLDIGAGCGETAFFYLLNGARKIVSIEPDRKATECLKENAKRNNWNVEIIQEAFKLEHLNIPHDFMKMDIEGHEIALLKAQITKPCIVEVHTKELARKLEEKGFKKIYSCKKGYQLMSFTTKSN
jgi:tRNA G37 N-methylase Trm5